MIEHINSIAENWWGWTWPMFWQVSLLITLVAGADILLRKKAWPQLRYALWLLVLVKLVLPPGLALQTSITSPAAELAEAVAPQGIVQPSEPAYSPSGFATNEWTADDSASADVVAAVGEAAPTAAAESPAVASVAAIEPASPSSKLHWRAYAMLAWLGGVVLLSGWLVVMLHKMRRLHGATSELSPELSALMASAAQRLKLKRLPKVVVSDHATSPAVFGVFKPVLLLPRQTVENYSPAELEHIFLHELAHLKRGDLVVHAANMLLQIAYWFNPLLWLVRKQLQHLRELCCDATVANILREKTPEYRETLLETARRLLAKPLTPGVGLLGLFEDSTRLLARLDWLEKKTWKRRYIRIAVICVSVVLMAACILPMAKLEAKPSQPAQPEASTQPEAAQPEATTTQPGEKMTVESVLAAVRRAQRPAGKIKIRWTSDMVSKGRDTPKGNVISPDWSGKVQREVVLFLDEKRSHFKWKTKSYRPPSSSQPERVTQYTGGFDGTRYKTLAEPVSGPQGPAYGSQAFNDETAPFLHHYLFGFSLSLPIHNPDRLGEYETTLARDESSGMYVLTLTIPNAHSHRLTVDPRRGWHIVDMKTFNSDGTPNVEYQAQLQQLADGTWLPAEWSWTSYMKGKILARKNGKVLEVDLNPAIGDELFDVKFPTGTKVHDVPSDKYFIAGQNDPLETQLLADVKAGIEYQQLAEGDEHLRGLRNTEANLQVQLDHLKKRPDADSEQIKAAIANLEALRVEIAAREDILANRARAGMTNDESDNQDVKDREKAIFNEVGKGNQAAVKAMLDRNPALINARSRNGGKTLLDQAALQDKQAMLEFLLSKGLDVNLRNSYSETPLFVAALTGRTELIRLLVERGADVHAADRSGQTPLHMAAMGGKSGAAELLIDHKAEVNVATKLGKSTPLHNAAWMGHVEACETLLKRGAKPDSQNRDGRTPLHYAVGIQSKPLVELMMTHGADPTIKDKDGGSPIDWAKGKNRRDIVKLLEKRPVDSEATQPASQPAAGSKLEFRIAPRPSELTEPELMSYRHWLKTGRTGFWWKDGRFGGIAGRMPDHAWLPFTGELIGADHLLTGEHKGQTYVLVSDKPGQIMVRGEGKDAWGLTRVKGVTKTRIADGGSYGPSAIEFELDDRGAEKFANLTKANVGKALALIVDGEVLSAPVLKMPLGKRGMITGRFSEQRAAAIVKALETGMKPPTTQPAGNVFKGYIVDMDGKPVPGASVVLVTNESWLTVRNGRPWKNNNPTLTTDTEGNVAIPMRTDQFLAVVLHDDGFTVLTSRQLASAKTISIEPWGQVVGNFEVTGEPRANQLIDVSIADPYNQSKPPIYFEHQVRTDEQGRFSFPRVYPGEGDVGHRIRLPGNSWPSTHTVPVEVKAGHTTSLTIGGKGAAVTGRVTPSGKYDQQINWKYGYGGLSLKEDARKYYSFPIDKDGSFRVTDVEPGVYRLRIALHDPPSREGENYGPKIGQVTREISIARSFGQGDSKTFDIGSVQLTSRTRQAHTQPAVTPPAGRAAGKLKGYVERFFRRNYRDITARKTIEWGEPKKLENGNLSIRYKYHATIRDKKKIINNQVFTFTKDGKFVSVKDVNDNSAAATTSKGVASVVDLQKLIDAAKPGSIVTVPRGTYDKPVTINKPLTLRGQSRSECIFELTSDQPAVTVRSKGLVTVENLTIKWQLETSEKKQEPTAAMIIRDATAIVQNCRFIAKGNFKRSPSALLSIGFSTLKLRKSRFDGFEFTIGYSGGSNGSVTDCVIMNPGHCGISIYSRSKVTIKRNIVAGSRFHALRSTGGTIIAKDNLLINNRNRGIYLGNKSASGTVSNNVISGNGTGISAFSRTKVNIKNNLIMASKYAGLGMQDSCRLSATGNIFLENARGIAVFKKTGRTDYSLSGNTFWGNKSDTENIELPANSMVIDPALVDPTTGDLSTGSAVLKKRKQGLTNPGVFKPLWKKWMAINGRPSVSKGLGKQLKGYVERFFSRNYRDITARKTIGWGKPKKLKNGNLSIRYKYRATIWDKDKIVQNKVFTFTKDGKFVSVKDVKNTPRPEPYQFGKAVNGFMCKLRPNKQLWAKGEEISFLVDVRNHGKRELSFFADESNALIEVDGSWYVLERPGPLKHRPTTFLPLSAGKQILSIPLVLDKRWREIKGDELESLPTPRELKGTSDGQPLEWSTGKHKVRVIMFAWSKKAINRQGKPLRFVSLPVEIRIGQR